MSIGIVDFFCLTVQGSKGSAPTFTAKPSIRQLGSGVEFEVGLTCDPAPSIVWYHGDQVIKDDGRFTTLTQTDGANYTLILRISDVTAQDGGSYRVTAKNKLGESNANINLNLDGKYFTISFRQDSLIKVLAV